MKEKKTVRKVVRQRKKPKQKWVWVKVYLSKAEDQMLKRQASKAHLSPSDYVRNVVRKAAGIDRETL